MHMGSYDTGVGTGDLLPMKGQRCKMRALNLTFRAWRKDCRMSAEQGCMIRVIFQDDYAREGEGVEWKEQERQQMASLGGE